MFVGPGEEGTGLTSLSCGLVLLTALLWGTTDACMKYFSPPAPVAESSPSLVQQLRLLLASPSYLACLAVNQLGSAVFYYSLATAPLSLVSPVVNTAKVVVTLGTGQLLGEPRLTARRLAGLLLLLAGCLLLVASTAIDDGGADQ